MDLLIADRDNNRVLIVSPAKRILWRAGGLPGPDDAFFTPGGSSIITNEEFNDTLAEVSLRTRRVIWRYGHAGGPGASRGYLNTPNDAYRLKIGGWVDRLSAAGRRRAIRPNRTGSTSCRGGRS